MILIVAAATLNRFNLLKHPRDMSGWGAVSASVVAEQVLAAAVLLAVSALGLFARLPDESGNRSPVF